MIDGGQQITSIEHHLQNGSDLFDTDPKGAMAAYYQVVSLEPTHVEGWNQIGRLMFDMQQYAEAEMVFKRVEQLSIQQGLADWAEMSVQNIELTRQTLAESALSEPPAPVLTENNMVQEELAPSESEPEKRVSEETQSITDIGKLADVAQIPAVDATVLLQPEMVQEIVEDTANGAQDTNLMMEIIDAPPATTPIAKAAAQTIEIVDDPLPIPEPVSHNTPVVDEQSVLDGSASMSDPLPPVHEATPPPSALPPPTSPEPFVPAAPVRQAASTAQMPFSEHLQAGAQLNAPQLGSQFPNMPMAAQPDPNVTQSAGAVMPPPAQSSVAPTMPFPEQPELARSAPRGADAAAQTPPSMVPPTTDAVMEEPKSSSGKIALMITGVVGAVGIGIGAAHYLNTKNEPAGAIPVIKSEVKLEPKRGVTSVIVPEVEVADEPAAPVVAKPQLTDRDRAYKLGMTHLVKGEFGQARPYLESAAAKGHAEASFNLASLYAKGEGVEQSYETAVTYLQKSSDGGYYPAMTNLGLLYAKGQGVKQNYLTARSYWLKAAAGEHADAMHNLAVIYATGKGVEQDMGEAIKWYRKGANGGYVDSIFDLGLLYANGNGVSRDYPEAKRLWETAAEKGHQLAARNLEKLNQVMAKQ